MDSHVKLDWYRSQIIDNRWRSEVLPPGEAELPPGDLPEADAGDQVPSLTPKQVEQKWPDTGLAALLALAK